MPPPLPPTTTTTGDLENRAEIREPATLLIRNATRSDTAKYRCEVTAVEDERSFDEIEINLVVRGTTSLGMRRAVVFPPFQDKAHDDAHKGRSCSVLHALGL